MSLLIDKYHYLTSFYLTMFLRPEIAITNY